ncbi:MAG: cytochrome c3 family protein [Paracoccaceae bacterium]
MKRSAILPALTCFFLGSGAPVPAVPAVDDSFGPHSLELQPGPDNAMCTFCHTPQGRRSDEPGWAVPRGASEFQSFDTVRADGSIEVIGSASIACLACHDGTQARDSVAIAPFVSDNGAAPMALLPETRDHPVGIPFSGYWRQDQSGPAGGSRLRRDVIGGQARWWLDLETVPNGVRDKTDVILYTRGEGAGAQPFIECTSCHDPHANPADKFLRAPNANSDLCQACHNY